MLLHQLLVVCALHLLLDCAAAETATFNVSNFVAMTLNDSAASIVTVEFELRTSHPAWAVWGLQVTPGDGGNATANLTLLRLGLTPNELTVDWGDASNRTLVNITDGSWHSVRIRLGNFSGGSGSGGGGGVSIGVDAADDLVSLASLWPSPTSAPLLMTFGGVNGTGGLRGCLANASVNYDVTAVQLYSTDAANASAAAPQNPGCLEDRCLCANNGSCATPRQWNLHAGCNCTGTGHEGPLCQQAIDYCALGGGSVGLCSGQGECVSITDRATFVCNCNVTSGRLGSRCQSSDPCLTQPCNGRGNCSFLGDPDLPGNLTHQCNCTDGYSGAACSDHAVILEPRDTRIVVGLVVGLLLLLLLGTAAGLAGKLLLDRRKDTGVYKPSDRETGGASGVQNLRDILHPPTEERLI